MSRTASAWAVVLAGALVLAACGGTEEAADPVVEDHGVAVAEPWIRTTAATQTDAAVYFTVTSDTDRALVGAAVDPAVADHAELHETVSGGEMAGMGPMPGMEHGEDTMAMREVDEVDLDGGQPVPFEPGGYHLMLVGLVRPLEAGREVTVALELDDGTEVAVPAEVRDDAP